MSKQMTTEQKILEDYRQDAIAQVFDTNELISGLSAGASDKELLGVCLSMELTVNKMRKYAAKAWGAEHEPVAAA